MEISDKAKTLLANIKALIRSAESHFEALEEDLHTFKKEKEFVGSIGTVMIHIRNVIKKPCLIARKAWHGSCATMYQRGMTLKVSSDGTLLMTGISLEPTDLMAEDWHILGQS